MELEYLPNTEAINTYKYYTVQTCPDDTDLEKRVVDAAEEESEIPPVFYVGKNAETKSSLREAFAERYRLAKTIPGAISTLQILRRKKIAPEMILVDGKFGEESLKELYCYLSAHALFSGVPYVINDDDLEKEAIEKLRSLEF